MTKLFAGGEMGAFFPSQDEVAEDTNAGKYNSDGLGARCSIRFPVSLTAVLFAQGASFPAASAADGLWFHHVFYGQAQAGETGNIAALMAGGTAALVLRCIQAGTPLNPIGHNQLSLWLNIAGTYTEITTGTDIDAQLSPITVDVHVTTTLVELYVAGSLRVSQAYDMSGLTGITSCRMYGLIGGDNFSEVIITKGESTIGWRLKTLGISGNGESSGWAGDYTDVDKVVWDDATYINTNTSGVISNFATTDEPAGYCVGVVVSARACKGDTGPTNIQFDIFTGGSNYQSASQALDAGFQAQQAIWETNPSTGAPWANAVVGAINYGLKAVA